MRWFWAAALGCLLAAGTACRQEGETDLPAAGQRTLRVWSMFQETEPLARWMESVAAGFEQANPGVRVEISWKGRDILSIARNAIQAGDPPDLIDQDDQTLIQLAKLDILAPLDEALGAAPELFQPAALALAEHDGHYYLWPRSLYTSGLFCQADVLRDLGREAPATWEDFLSLCRAIKAKGGTPLAADGTVDFYNDWWFAWLATRIAGPDKFLRAALNQGVSWSDPDFLRAAEAVETLVREEFFQQGYAGSVFPRAQHGWITGRQAMMLCGAWLPKEMEPSITDIEERTGEPVALEMFAFPEVAGGRGGFQVAEAWFNGWAVPRDAREKELAVEFLRFATSEENVRTLVAAGDPSAVRGAAQPRFLEAQARIFERATVFVPQKDGIGREAPEWTRRVLHPVNNQLFKGQIGAAEFIAALQSAHDAFYAAKDPTP